MAWCSDYFLDISTDNCLAAGARWQAELKTRLIAAKRSSFCSLHSGIIPSGVCQMAQHASGMHTPASSSLSLELIKISSVLCSVLTTQILTAGSDGTARLWAMPVLFRIDQARKRLPRLQFTVKEKEQIFVITD